MTDISLIFRQNPWWQDPKKVNDDPRLLSLKDLPLVWTPRAILSMDLESDGVHILTGPRQVGKSTTVRMIIRQLLFEKNVEPKRVLLFNCDIVPSAKELVDIVLSFLEGMAPPGRRYLFLDEISSVPEWPNAIKWLVDQGQGKGCTFLLTGSSSVKIKKSGEFLPGRRGAGKDIAQLPLTFKEFAELLGAGLPAMRLTECTLKDLQTFHADVCIKLPDLKGIFSKFLIHGGFLRPLNELARGRFIPSEINEIYLGWIRSEAAKDGKKESVVRGMVDRIGLSLGSGLSYQALAEHLDLGSHNTARAYLDFLKDSFVIDEVPFAEVSQRRVAWRKNRKYYFTDPFLHWLCWLWTKGGDDMVSLASDEAQRPQGMGPVLENVIQDHIRRYHQEVCFGEHRGQEIDFCLLKEQIGVEVKFQPKVTSSDVAALKMFPRAFCVSRDALQEIGGVKVLPAHLFCLLDAV